MASDIVKIGFTVAVWVLGIMVGLAIVATLAEGLIAFASTGIGAVILLFVAYRIYKLFNN